MNEPSDIWTSSDVAKHFKCSLPHVRKLVAAHALPHLRLGRLLRFRRSDVLAWEADQIKRGAA